MDSQVHSFIHIKETRGEGCLFKKLMLMYRTNNQLIGKNLFHHKGKLVILNPLRMISLK